MKRTLHRFGLGFVVFLLGSNAWAINGINVQTFNPSTSNRFVFLEDGYMAEWPKTTKYYFGANYNYFNEPLSVLDSTQTVKLYDVISSIQTFDFFFGMRVHPRVGLFLGLPIHYVNYPIVTGAMTSNRPNATVMGDLKLMGKIRLTDDAPDLSVALIPELHFPTGSNTDFVSDASAYVGLRLAVERKFEGFTFIGNLGYAAASNAFYSDSTFTEAVNYQKRLLVGLGGLVPFNSHWGLNVELSNINSIPFDKNLNPNDLYGGIRYETNSWVMTGGMSLGRIGGVQQNLRFVAGLRFNVYEEQKLAPRPINLYKKK